MRRRWMLQGVALAVLWMLVRGATLTVSGFVTEFVLGLGVGLVISYSLRRFYAPRSPLVWRPRTLRYVLGYVWTFVKQLVVSNLDVARLTLSPSMPIEPTVVDVPLRVRSDVAITTIANSITLTPGTLTINYDEENHSLSVHSIDGDRESLVESVRTWEDYAFVIFGETPTPIPSSGDEWAGGQDDD